MLKNLIVLLMLLPVGAYVVHAQNKKNTTVPKAKTDALALMYEAFLYPVPSKNALLAELDSVLAHLNHNMKLIEESALMLPSNYYKYSIEVSPPIMTDSIVITHTAIVIKDCKLSKDYDKGEKLNFYPFLAKLIANRKLAIHYCSSASYDPVPAPNTIETTLKQQMNQIAGLLKIYNSVGKFNVTTADVLTLEAKKCTKPITNVERYKFRNSFIAFLKK